MNVVIIMGRLTKDPEVRYTQGQNSMAVARYTLAVERRGRKDDSQQQADFIRCVAFGRSAEFAEKYFRKGLRVAIDGRIQTGSYQDKNGNTVYTTDVVVNNQEFADGKNSGSGSSENSNSSNGNYEDSSVGDGFLNIPDGVEDEGLPFN